MDHAFTTDGCSGCLMFFIRLYWVWRYGELPPWEPDCIDHDKSYWLGGTAAERVTADAVLTQAIARHGYPVLARIVFIGVSIGGMPRLPFPWRWAYCWKWKRLKGYEDETPRDH